MKVTICIGSSCHLKGSRQIVERLQALIQEQNLEDQVELAGTFCLGKCKTGVNIQIDEAEFSVSPETVDTFFETEILSRVK